MSLPGVGHEAPAGTLLIPPGEDRPIQPATSGELPFRFGGKLRSRPGAIGFRIGKGDMDDRMIGQPVK